jgi:deazaflavin-dependent oxidoreductase (nitroreductase family)
MEALDPSLAAEQYCYLTTTGRSSGEPREIELWFGLEGSTVYLLSGMQERSNWVRNLIADPAVAVTIAGRRFDGRARIVDDPDEDALARRLLLDKYAQGYSGDLTDYRQNALPVAIEIESSGPHAPAWLC